MTMTMFRGFWGLALVPGKSYSQTVDASFRLSNAALGTDIEANTRTSVVVTVDEHKFVLCSLTPSKIEQQSLDIILTEGEEVTFEVQGDNTIHLTGNFIAELSEDSDEESDDDNDIDLSELTPEELQEMIEEGLIDPDKLLEDSDDEDYDSDDAEADERIREITSEDEAKMIKEVESEEEPELVPIKEVKIKKQAEKKRKVAEEAAKPAEEPTKSKKSKKEKAKEAKEEKSKDSKDDGKKSSKTLAGGVVAEIKKEGTGAGAKKGARVGMYYIGKLTNGKVFDQNTKGKPFWFRLGAGEVIKGWDVGIIGMNKGAERRLTIPASMAYGKRGAPPDIPPNSTLVFDIRLVDFK
ncbi:hypothetical protein COEREDRAFT_80401 [Coemansia reversa NRRL 1564]|uniref:peptidylprolyl isomerase n=1 Tax=Coemansia reversa (strain ATCC 12441 / NRRL 1564) TaxID=763665 RepID=A0A2G5BFG1_COERN|nr:hypothetical protein COEREDRAFT_80401 [Coemansia reversa NRRL 1564]|eukprot:PIA17743.1 hypothetical protein COEREDRAFT_80401 [Coemansia reversa NRRL 1564]